MSVKKSLANQLEQEVQVVLDRMMRDRIEEINVIHVADLVERNLDPDRVTPALIEYGSLTTIKQFTMTILRKSRNPIVVAERIADGQGEMFSDYLQDYYPVNRNGIKLYAIRHTLSEMEVLTWTKRMRRAGEHLLKHADALEAEFYSRDSESVA